MSAVEEPSERIRQNAQADNGGVAFVQGAGNQHNQLTQHFYGPGAVAPNDPEGSFRYGKLKWEAREFSEAEWPLTHAAEAGHTEAMDLLRLLYLFTGRHDKEKHWTQKLAECGDPDACDKMARDIERDIEFRRGHTRRYLPLTELVDEALGWYRKGYEAGQDKMAQPIGLLLYAEYRREEAIPYLEEALRVIQREGERDEHGVGWRLNSARKELERQQKKQARQQEKSASPSGNGNPRRWWRPGS
ncbi:hypothetical protein ACTPOK_29615 [Streptomyces inhibens]|uniref:hypothetical protein n=1 Tax=Streptomyces inhibens TaxID=2293571 RepID=UPI00402AACBE